MKVDMYKVKCTHCNKWDILPKEKVSVLCDFADNAYVITFECPICGRDMYHEIPFPENK